MHTFIYQFAGWGTRALEFALGAVFLVHGWAKVKNPSILASFWWGSKKLAMLHGLAEMAAALAVITGFGTFYGALVMIVVMLGAIYSKIFTWKLPFWSQNNTGWEFDLVILAGALAILLG